MRRDDQILNDRALRAEPQQTCQRQTKDVSAGFRACYQAHAKELLGFATSRIGRVDAEDLVAETFARAWKSLPLELHNGAGDARPWLFHVLRNLLTDRARRNEVADRAQARLRNQASASWLDASEDLAEQDRVRQALASLAPRQRLVLELRFAADLDATEAGVLLGLQADAVRALTYRATRALRAALAHLEAGAPQDPR